MNNYCKLKLRELEEAINNHLLEIDDQIILCEKLIELVIDCLTDVKSFIKEKDFATIEDQIYFFKNLKPKFTSKLIYYNAVYKIETKKPFGGEKVVKKYLNDELSKLKRYFDNNLDFYKYFRTGSIYLDHKYFVRGRHDIKLSLDTFYFESDHSFSTSHDFKVAKIIANDLIEVYLEDQLLNIKRNPACIASESYKETLQWTGSKTALIELIYALHNQSVFENGNVEIKGIAGHFEKMFNIDLGDVYHTYLELRTRKNNRTKFLDSLRDDLIRKMDDLEEK